MCLNCHVVSVEIEVKDLDALERACKTLGYTLHRGRQNQWYGRWVDDSPLPRHVFKNEEDYQKALGFKKHERQAYMTALFNSAKHAISIPGATYEIGLVQKNDGYALVWDAWRGQLNLNPLVQQYAVEATIAQAQSQGNTWQQETLKDGSIQLKIGIPDYGVPQW